MSPEPDVPWDDTEGGNPPAPAPVAPAPRRRRARSSITGRFVTLWYALRHKRTTQVEGDK
jgi:hypothetical protein